MKCPSYCLILLFLLFSGGLIKQVNGQNDTLFDFYESSWQYDSDLIHNLPVEKVKDIFQIDPAIYRPDGWGSFFIDGFKTSDDYTWFDGMPVRFTEDMPLRLIGNARFDGFSDYFKHGNSLTGFSCLLPVNSADSFSLRVESTSTLIHKLFNDSDIQLLLSGRIRLNNSGSEGSVKVSYSLSSRLFTSSDADPSYIYRNKASEEWRNSLVSEPLRPSGFGDGTNANALYTEPENSVATYFNSNAAKKGFSLFGSIKADLQHGMSFNIGSYTVSKKQAIPLYDNFFFNHENNPEQSTLYTSNYLGFEQELVKNESVQFRYQLRAQYTYENVVTQDPDHGKDLFNYGYVGRFDTYKTPTFQIGSDSVNGSFYDDIWLLNSWDYDTLVEFTPGNANPDLSSYTSSYYAIYQDDPVYHYQNKDQVQLGGGLLNGQQPDRVYNLYNNTGTVYNQYGVDNQQQLRIFADGSLAVGKHTIDLGFQFRRDSYAAYHIVPARLWGLMNSVANWHLNGLDFSNPMLHEGEDLDTIFYSRKYDGESQRVFDRRLREAIGLDPDGLDFIDIDSYDYDNNTISYYDKDGYRKTIQLTDNPFSLDLFSPEELYNFSNQNLYCSGYDYKGERIKNKVSFEEFFTAVDEEGEYLRQIGSYNPLNYSAYADYKVSLKDWSVVAGFRLDIFDANQQVLEDPYLWYEAFTVGDLAANAGFSYTIPDGIGNDYVVYVDNVYNPTEITGFRDGDNWYDHDGNPTLDPGELDVGSGISPYLIDHTLENVTPAAFSSNKINFNILPQLSIQKVFAGKLLLSIRYNSSVKNPENYQVYNNPALFYFYTGTSYYIPNGSLKPERADRIKAGLAYQPINKFFLSITGFADYYSNLIQPVFLYGAYPASYFSYTNMSEPAKQFGADLGLSHFSGKSSGFNYGLNYHFLLNNDDFLFYFDSKAPANLLKGYFTYNTGFGRDYAGPAGKTGYKIFESLGVGAFAQFQSGVAYAFGEKNQGYTRKNLPWAAFLDLKIEKGLHFNNNKYLLTIYCVIQNLFNSEIILEVYHNTGEPDDDGYLSDPMHQKEISETLSEESYRFLYSSYVNDPGHYGLPRRTTFGISFSFETWNL